MFSINNQISAVSTGSTRLEGNKIHTVKLTNVEATTVGNDSKYDVVSLTFEGVGESKGTFTDTLFAPKSADRTPNNYGGENPSPVEELLVKIRQYISVFNPKLHESIENGSKPIDVKTWEELRKVMVKAFTPGIGVETELKLLKNKTGNATLPGYIAGIASNGNLYPKTNFIGKGLEFTKSELSRINAAATATATDVSSLLGTTLSGGSEDLSSGDKELDFDLDSL